MRVRAPVPTLMTLAPTPRPLGGLRQRRHWRIDLFGRQRLHRLVSARARFHGFQDEAPLGGDLPAAVFARDEPLREDVRSGTRAANRLVRCNVKKLKRGRPSVESEAVTVRLFDGNLPRLDRWHGFIRHWRPTRPC